MNVMCWLLGHKYTTPYERAGHEIPHELRPEAGISKHEINSRFAELNRQTCDRCGAESERSREMRRRLMLQ